jgi:hypothetical protein
MIRERVRSGVSGLAALVVLLGLLLLAGLGFSLAARAASVGGVLGWLATIFVIVFSFAGLFVVNPNQGQVL